MHPLIISFFFWPSWMGGANALQFQPLTMDVGPSEEIFVRGYEGEIQVSQVAGAQLTVQVRQVAAKMGSIQMKDAADEWLFSVEKVGNRIEIKVKSPPQKAQWVNASQIKQAPRFMVELRAPSRPLQIVWERGQVRVAHWTGPLIAHLESGEMRLGSGSGDAEVSIQNGTFFAEQRSGSMEVQSFQGAIKLDQMKGDVRLLNYSGSTSIQNSKANFTLTGFDGPFILAQNEGRINFRGVRSRFNISQHKGDLRGDADQGLVSVQMSQFNELRLKTRAADVSLTLPGSGASLNLGTVEGQIYAPSAFQILRSGRMKNLRGRLSGKEPGRVHVRSETGSLRLKSS